MQINNEPEFPFFCHICGVAPTWRGMLAASTLQYLDPEEADFDHRDYRYGDFMPGNDKLGYDARLLRPKSIRWLDAVRLVTDKIADTLNGTETESPVPLLSPLAAFVDIWSGTFHYPDNSNILGCNVDGFLVHDTCIKMLERVHGENTCSAEQLDLGRLWDWLKLGSENRNKDLIDWGFGDAFYGSGTRWPGKRFDIGYQEWTPVKESMWTVMDPDGPFDCHPLLERAAVSTEPGYSFTFSVKPPPTQAAPNANVLSLLPRELQMSILELLPTSSVLNLFLASSDFRHCAEHLPPSFWKSRLFFDVPWCADIILSEISQTRGNRTGGTRVQFNKLLHFLKDFYASPGKEPEGENLPFKGLRNRRRIWMNCKWILREIEVQRLDNHRAGEVESSRIADYE
ncbi:hypothetical protein BJX70DRAFT_405361 [Aspergillus crustosus]